MLVHEHRVRYHEADAQGYLFNSRYLEIADVAMTEFFRLLGWDYPDLVAGGTDPAVVNASLTFATPARFDDTIGIDVHCAQVGRSSFVLAMRFLRETTVVAEVSLTYVNVDAAAAQSRPLPDDVARALREAGPAPPM